MPSMTVKTGSWPELKEYCKPIRLSVFVEEQHVPRTLELDGMDNNYLHIVIFDERNTPIATARLANNGKLGRMAVLKKFRQQGLGTELLKQLTTLAESLKLKKLFCHAQSSATDFYKKNGFLIIGKPFDEAGITHLMMIKMMGTLLEIMHMDGAMTVASIIQMTLKMKKKI